MQTIYNTINTWMYYDIYYKTCYLPPSNVSMQSGASPPLAWYRWSHIGIFTAKNLRLSSWLKTKSQTSLHTKLVRISQARRHIYCSIDTLYAGSQVGNVQRQMKGRRYFKHCLCTVNWLVNKTKKVSAVFWLVVMSPACEVFTAIFTGWSNIDWKSLQNPVGV